MVKPSRSSATARERASLLEFIRPFGAHRHESRWEPIVVIAVSLVWLREHCTAQSGVVR